MGKIIFTGSLEWLLIICQFRVFLSLEKWGGFWFKVAQTAQKLSYFQSENCPESNFLCIFQKERQKEEIEKCKKIVFVHLGPAVHCIKWHDKKREYTNIYILYQMVVSHYVIFLLHAYFTFFNLTLKLWCLKASVKLVDSVACSRTVRADVFCTGLLCFPVARGGHTCACS